MLGNKTKEFEKIKRQLLMLEPITSAITLDMNINELFISLMAPITQVLESDVNILLLKKNEKYYIAEYYSENEINDFIGREIDLTQEEKDLFSELYIINKIDSVVKSKIKNIYDFFSTTFNLKFNSILVAPLKKHGYKIILNKKPDSFHENNVVFCRIICNILSAILLIQEQVAEIIEKQRDEKELEIASEIQKELLPKKTPQIDNIDIFGFSIPVKNMGGDYYDFLNFKNEKFGVVIADVAGKGVPAALVMVMIRSILRTIVRSNVNTADTITYLNRIIASEITQERFVTLIYYVLDTASNKMFFSNAGHNPLLVYRNAKNDFDLFDSSGIPVGIVKNEKYSCNEIKINKGDIIILYTDGIVEAMNEQREEFSMEQLMSVIKKNVNKSAKEMGDHIKASIDSFVGTAPQHDDQTVVILKAK